MNRSEFREMVTKKLVILDGATGTELVKRGMPQGVSPELWVLDNPDILAEIQQRYVAAGSDIIYTCTFGANRIKLAEFTDKTDVSALNRDLAMLSRKVSGDAFVFGNISPTGRIVEPFGDLGFEEAVSIYSEQVQGLLAGGVDGFVVETMMDIQEARAVLIAIRETCDLPAMVSMTFGEDGRTLTGTDPTSALITLQSLGADAVGCNCSTGPADMITFIHAMKPHATVPLIAKPNAGMPKLIDGVTCFDMGAKEFASFVEEFVNRGVNLLGGCCGSDHEFIRALKKASDGLKPQPPAVEAVSAVSSPRKSAFLGDGRPVQIIGERINPTGKKKLQAELRAGKLDQVRQYALEQSEAGASLLDINMGLSGIDENEMMRKCIALLSQLTDIPLCIDTTDPQVMETALRLYPGRALVNSVSAEKAKLEQMLPIAAKYGAMFILLPLTDDEIPATCTERIEVINTVFAEAQKFGYHLNDIVVDGLVMTVSSAPEASIETLKLIDWCSNDFGTNTTIGTSNVSFGLPERKWINATFLAMAIGRGLSTAIANPSAKLTMEIKTAADALAGRDRKLANYIKHFTSHSTHLSTESKASTDSPDKQLYEHVITGNQDNVAEAIDAALAAGLPAQKLVDTCLIPAITKVGELFDKKEYFLPQLMMSADTMRTAFDHLTPHLEEAENGEEKHTTRVILATVKGDIHDIGKNLVALMLKNYGFKVLDLGKDISAADIVKAAKEHKAHIVGLSALMTTTMIEMQEVIDLARDEGLETLFMVGGAVVDAEYADKIGADGYSTDAIGAVRLAQDLTNAPK